MSETGKDGPDLEPTPTPWEVERHTNGVIFITALHARGGDIADLYHKTEDGRIITKDNAETNAALITTAVNAHSALVEACKEFVRKCECGEARSVKSYAQMKAALLLAEGEKE